MWAAVMADADSIAESQPDLSDPDVEVRDEIRDMMPALLAHLSPEARHMIRDWNSHVGELVAFVHRASAYVAA